MAELKLDFKDHAILESLQKNGRATYAELAEQVQLTVSSARERVLKLERDGLIQGYTANLDAEKLGLPVTAFVSVSTNNNASKLSLEHFAEVEECYSIAGDDNLLLKVRAASPRALNRFLESLLEIEGVYGTRSTIVLETQFERRPLPLPEIPTE
jgi:Lrp/AsnC family leucine-responsive transcriptional regulator